MGRPAELRDQILSLQDDLIGLVFFESTLDSELRSPPDETLNVTATHITACGRQLGGHRVNIEIHTVLAEKCAIR